MPSPFVHTLSSFSGSDLVVSFANKPLGNIQSISWGIQREKVPVFTLGSADARSVSRGKRAIGGSVIFAAFDHDALLEAMKEIWDKIAPPAMFTAAGNVSIAGSEDFSNAMDMARWNNSAQASFESFEQNPRGEALSILNGLDGILNSWDSITAEGFKWGSSLFHPVEAIKDVLATLFGDKSRADLSIDKRNQAKEVNYNVRMYIENGNFKAAKDEVKNIDSRMGEINKGMLEAIKKAEAASKASNAMPGYPGGGVLTKESVKGSNNTFDFKNEQWNNDGDDVYVPQGFSPIRGENILYADMIPPVDCTLTFANEYGQCAFKKIYDMDFLNEGSGVSVDTIVMEQQFTYIARRISPLIKGVYTRESGGVMKGVSPVVKKSAKAYRQGFSGSNSGL